MVRTPWYVYLAKYLEARKHPAHLPSRENNLIIQHSVQFPWIDGYLFHMGLDLQICKFIRDDKIYDFLKVFHDEPCGGNFIDQRIGHKLLQMGYY